jgi:uncharacterized protein
MRHLRPTDYRIMPWKNGGGSTTEVAVFPENSTVSGSSFAWRVSIAEVSASGPFSRFAGYERHIMTIEGDGMLLEIEQAPDIELRNLFVPACFSGDWTVSGRLVGGPTRDFNLIVAKTFGRSDLSVKSLEMDGRHRTADGIEVLYVETGELLAGGRLIGTGDTLVSENERVELRALHDPARLIIGRIAPIQALSS